MPGTLFDRMKRRMAERESVGVSEYIQSLIEEDTTRGSTDREKLERILHELHNIRGALSFFSPPEFVPGARKSGPGRLGTFDFDSIKNAADAGASSRLNETPPAPRGLTVNQARPRRKEDDGKKGFSMKTEPVED
jgi:hypothetical protein